MEKSRFGIKNKYKLFMLFVLLVCAIVFALFFRLDSENYKVLLACIRIPSVVRAFIAGACLSLAGMFMQGVSKNPLADPYLSGLSSGAGLFIVISILWFNGVNYSLFGFIGALISAFFVILICGFSKFTVTKLILTGLSVNLFAGSLISFLILTNPEKAYEMTLILTGGISYTEIHNAGLISIFLGIIILCLLLVPKLNLFRLDDRIAFKSQKEVNKYNIIFIVLSALLTSLSVYCAGILGFLGIICPVFCKVLLGEDYRTLFFANIFAGAFLLIMSNVLSIRLVYPLVIPLGVVVALIGAPIFVYFLLKKGGMLGN